MAISQTNQEVLSQLLCVGIILKIYQEALHLRSKRKGTIEKWTKEFNRLLQRRCANGQQVKRFS
jgi:hypothetical protein